MNIEDPVDPEPRMSILSREVKIKGATGLNSCNRCSSNIINLCCKWISSFKAKLNSNLPLRIPEVDTFENFSG